MSHLSKLPVDWPSASSQASVNFSGLCIIRFLPQTTCALPQLIIAVELLRSSPTSSRTKANADWKQLEWFRSRGGLALCRMAFQIFTNLIRILQYCLHVELIAVGLIVAAIIGVDRALLMLGCAVPPTTY